MPKFLKIIGAETLTEAFNKVKDAPTPLNILATTASVMGTVYMTMGSNAANIDTSDWLIGTGATLLVGAIGYIHGLTKSSEMQTVIQTIASAALVPALVAGMNAKDNLMCLPVDASTYQMQKIYPLSDELLSEIANKEIAQNVLLRSKSLGMPPDGLKGLFDEADKTKDRKINLGDREIAVPERGAFSSAYLPIFYNTQPSSICAHVGDSIEWLESGVIDVEATTKDIVTSWGKKIKENINAPVPVQ
jgi:hypothetical protein